MNQTFTLTINLGNEAMTDTQDVADALLKIVHRLRHNEMGGLIHDANGNRVGQWEGDFETSRDV